MLSNRCCNILARILQSYEGFKIRQLAEEYYISERAVRYDLDAIDFFLKQLNHTALLRKTNFGVNYIAGHEQREAVLKSIRDMDISRVLLTPAERTIEILYKLVFTNEIIKIDNEADRLAVSKSTIVKDLERIKSTFCDKNIYLSTCNKGISIKGDEGLLRNLVAKMFMTGMDNQTLIAVQNYLTEKESILYNKTFKWLFEDLNKSLLRSLANTYMNQYKAQITGTNLIFLAIHIVLIIKRMAIGCVFRQCSLERSFPQVDLIFAEEAAKHIINTTGIELPAEEIFYLSSIVKLFNSGPTGNEDNINRAELQILSCYIAENVTQLTGIDFLSDITLISGLSQELQIIVYSSLNRLPYKSSFHPELRKRYLYLYDAVEKSLIPLSEFLNREVSENEAFCITSHFAVSIEKGSLNSLKRLNIVVVCNMGTHILKMLCNKLCAIYNINLVYAVAFIENESELKQKQVDYIISTIFLNIEGIKCLKVSPLLVESDIIMLKKYLPTKVVDSNSVREILDAVKKSCVILNDNKLTEDIVNILGVNKSIDVITEDIPTFLALLKPDCVQLQFEASGWEEAVIHSGNMLLKNGYIKEPYINEMLETIKQIGSKIVIGNGIAFSHARNYEASLGVGLTVLTLKNPVWFIDEQGKKADIIFALSAVDNKSHLKALSQLAKFLIKNDNANRLRKCNSSIEAVQVLKGYAQIFNINNKRDHNEVC